MARRCYSETPIDGDQATLDGSEAHHLLHVLRAAPGMSVTLFDGSGCEFDAEVTACKRSTVELAITERREVDRELPQPLVLGVALPKGDRQRWIIEKSVELGVTRLVPLITERSEKQGGDKLGRYVIEASKQCGRNRLMEIAEPVRWGDWLATESSAGGVSDADSRARPKDAPPLGRSSDRPSTDGRRIWPNGVQHSWRSGLKGG